MVGVMLRLAFEMTFRAAKFPSRPQLPESRGNSSTPTWDSFLPNAVAYDP